MAIGHVTGRTVFTTDRTFPGLLHLKVVRSPVHHARIRGVDLSEAERVPGFVRALTHADVPHNVYTILGLIGVEPEEEFVLAGGSRPLQGRADRGHRRRVRGGGPRRGRAGEAGPRGAARRLRRGGGPQAGRARSSPTGATTRSCTRATRAGGSASATWRRPSRAPTTSSRASTTPSPSSTRPPRRPAASRCRRRTAGSPSTPTRRPLYFSLDNTSIILQVPGNQLHFVGGTVGGGFGGKVDVIVEPLATLAAMKTEPAGAVRLQPLGGDAGLVDAQRVAHLHQGRRHGRRPASSPAR